MVTVVGVAAFAMVGRLPVLTHVVFVKTPNHARRRDTKIRGRWPRQKPLFIEETCRQERFRRRLLHLALRRQDGDLCRFSGHFRPMRIDCSRREGPETRYLSRNPVNSRGTGGRPQAPTRRAAV